MYCIYNWKILIANDLLRLLNNSYGRLKMPLNKIFDHFCLYFCDILFLQPGAPFGVEISKDRQSLNLKLHPAIPLSGLGKRKFTYTVQVDSIPNKKSIGIVNIDARVYLRNKTVTSRCPHGRMWLPGMPIARPTTRRFVVEQKHTRFFIRTKFLENEAQMVKILRKSQGSISKM